MIKLEKYQSNKVYMYPNGEVATSERIRQDFPAVAHFTHVLELNGEVCQGVMNLSALRGIYNISSELSDDEAISAIETILNTPPAEPETTPEERIASQLEFQSMMIL